MPKPRSSSKAKDTAAIKVFALEAAERNREATAQLSDALFYFGELGLQEHESAGLLASLLDEAGCLCGGFDLAECGLVRRFAVRAVADDRPEAGRLGRGNVGGDDLGGDR